MEVKETVLLVTSTERSDRCLYKNHLLSENTLNWGQVECTKHKGLKLHYLGDNEEALRVCEKKNIDFTYVPKKAGHLQDVVAWWRHHGCPNIILAQPTQPLREHWLLTDMLKKQAEEPDTMGVTIAEGEDTHWRGRIHAAEYPRRAYGNGPFLLTGSIYCLPKAVMATLAAMPFPSLTGQAMWSVEQNSYCFLDIDAPWQLPGRVELLQKVSTAVHLGRPCHLPADGVVLVGSNASLKQCDGARIDSAEKVVRINHVPIDPAHTGTRCDYHLTKYPHCILQDETNEKFYSAPKLISGRWKNAMAFPEYWPQFDHTTEPWVEEIAHQTLATAEKNDLLNDPNAFISTGLMAIFYCLTHGARKISLAGYGGGSGGEKVCFATGQTDQFAEKEWLKRENRMLEKLGKEGYVSHLESN
jgi:hypothetical protein